MDDMMWVWVAIAAVVLVIIIVIAVIVARRKGKERNRERAAELRSRAAADDQLISTREDRAGQLEAEAEAARQKALAEYERAESLRAQAEQSDEMAAKATDEARILADEAEQSRESFETAVAEHEETLREADRRDPDVNTDRHGNRIEDSAPIDEEPEAEEEVVVIPVEERLDIGDDYSGDEFAEPDAEYIDPVDHERLEQLADTTPHEDQEADSAPEDEYVAEANRLDELNEAATPEGNGATAVVLDSDGTMKREDDESADSLGDEEQSTRSEPISDHASRNADGPLHPDEAIEPDDETGTTSDPDVDYIDPAEHDRLAESDEDLLLGNDDALSEASDPDDDDRAVEEPTHSASIEPDAVGRLQNDHEEVDQLPNESAIDPEVLAAPEADEGPVLDPYGNPVIVQDDKLVTDASALETDDDIGHRVDPYGNPIIEESGKSISREADNLNETPADDPYVTDDADDDLPRDEQGRRLDPYGNPVPENLQ